MYKDWVKRMNRLPSFITKKFTKRSNMPLSAIVSMESVGQNKRRRSKHTESANWYIIENELIWWSMQQWNRLWGANAQYIVGDMKKKFFWVKYAK